MTAYICMKKTVSLLYFKPILKYVGPNPDDLYYEMLVVLL